MKGRDEKDNRSAFAKYLLGEDVPVAQPAVTAPVTGAKVTAVRAREAVAKAGGWVSGVFKSRQKSAPVDTAPIDKEAEAVLRQKEIESKRAKNLEAMRGAFAAYVGNQSPGQLSRLFNDLAGDFSETAALVEKIPKINKKLMNKFLAALKANKLVQQQDAIKILRASEFWVLIVGAYIKAANNLFDKNGNVKADIAHILSMAAVDTNIMSKDDFDKLLEQDFFKAQLIAGYVTNIISVHIIENLSQDVASVDKPYSSVGYAGAKCFNDLAFNIAKNKFDKFIFALIKLKNYPVTFSPDQHEMKKQYVTNALNAAALIPADESFEPLIEMCSHFCASLDGQKDKEQAAALKQAPDALAAINELMEWDEKYREQLQEWDNKQNEQGLSNEDRQAIDTQRMQANDQLRKIAEKLHKVYVAIRNLSPGDAGGDDLLPVMAAIMAPTVNDNPAKYLMNSEFTDKLAEFFFTRGDIFNGLPDFETRLAGPNNYYLEAHASLNHFMSAIIISRVKYLIEHAAELHPEQVARQDLQLMLEDMVADAKGNPNASEAAKAIAAKININKIGDMSAEDILNVIREFKGLPQWQKVPVAEEAMIPLPPEAPNVPRDDENQDAARVDASKGKEDVTTEPVVEPFVDDERADNVSRPEVTDESEGEGVSESEASALLDDHDHADVGPAAASGMIPVDMTAESKLSAKISTLTEACDDYMTYLGRLIYEGILDHDYELLKNNKTYQLLHRPDANSRIQFKIARIFDSADINGDDEKVVREEIQSRVNAICNRDEKFKLLVEKYAAMREMRAILTYPDAKPEQKLQSFKQSFDVKRPLIEKRRDSKEMVFIKKVITVLTAGLAYLAGMWKIKGKEFSGAVDAALSDDDKQKKKPK